MTDWGSAGEWAGALGSFAAAAAAVWIAVRDGRHMRGLREDEQAGQARLITSAVEPDLFGFRFAIHNHSSAPVYGVFIHQVTSSPDPVRFGFSDEQTHEWGRLDPGQVVTGVGQAFDLERDRRVTLGPPQLLTADIRYVDSAGIEWRRYGNSPPRRMRVVRAPDPPASAPRVDYRLLNGLRDEDPPPAGQ